MSRVALLSLAIFLVLGGPTAYAKPAKPWLPVRVAEADTLHWQSLVADWRIREATHVPHPTYDDLYSPEEARHWLRELTLPSCERIRRNVIDCVAGATVWDNRSGRGETTTWHMRVRRYRDDRVRGGLVTHSRLLGASDWSDLPVREVTVTS